MRSSKILSCVFLLSLFSFLPLSVGAAKAQPEKTENKKNKSPSGAKIQYVGDPAFKRGVELGYDAGIKAGKSDRKESKKLSPATHPEYKSAEKKFRSEYGNRGRFVNGYQGGFNKGYRTGYSGGKPDLHAVKSKEKLDKNTSPSSSPTTPAKTAPRKHNPADDAL